MSDLFTVTARDHDKGIRLDKLLSTGDSGLSRSRLKALIEEGCVTQSGETITDASLRVKPGQTFSVEIPEAKDYEPEAENIPLDIVYEDDDLLVLNKPAGMVVHPGAGNHQGTLVNALLHHAPQLEIIPRAGIVHRIDKGTTGLLMIAKTLQAHNSLVNQLQERTVKREYQAIAMGVMTAGGTVDEPIGRHHIERKRMAVTNIGKPAITHYRVEKRYRAHTHIRCKLETGRTHQIRVHMAHIRYPLLGDPSYGGRIRLPKGATESCREALRDFKRQALHAGSLGFIHPATEQEVSWQVDMPQDLLDILAVLETDLAQNS